MSSTNYPKLKEAMAAAGYTVSPGNGFNNVDLGSYRNFALEQPFITGQYMDPSKAFYAIAFPVLLPAELAALVSTGLQVGNVAVWADAANPSDPKYLYTGTGNPVDGFQVTNGANVQVGLSLRYRNDLQLPVAGPDGVYKLDTSKNGNPWIFVFSAATSGDALLSDYDVTLTLGLDASGAATPVLEFTLDGNNWVSDPAGTDITDSAGVADKVVQNIQQYKFDYIKNQLLPTSQRSAAIPYGTFNLTLKAVHKETGEVAATTVKAVVTNVEPA